MHKLFAQRGSRAVIQFPTLQKVMALWPLNRIAKIKLPL